MGGTKTVNTATRTAIAEREGGGEEEGEKVKIEAKREVGVGTEKTGTETAAEITDEDGLTMNANHHHRLLLPTTSPSDSGICPSKIELIFSKTTLRT